MSDLWTEYSEKVIEHFKNPQNVGEIKNPSGVGRVGNPVCGDVMQLYIKVKNDIIVDIIKRMKGVEPDLTRPEYIMRIASLVGLILSLIIPDYILRKLGFKRTKPFKFWRYEKEMEKGRLVISLSLITNQYLKWYYRWKYSLILEPNPLKRLLKKVWYVMKWEVQPTYRFVMDILTNRKSIGVPGAKVTYRTGPDAVIDIAKYFITNVLPMYFEPLPEAWTNPEYSEYIQQVEKDFPQDLEMLRFVLLVLGVGYPYLTKTQKELNTMFTKILDAQVKKEIRKIKRSKLNPEAQQQAIKNLLDYHKRLLKQINTVYPVEK